VVGYALNRLSDNDILSPIILLRPLDFSKTQLTGIYIFVYI